MRSIKRVALGHAAELRNSIDSSAGVVDTKELMGIDDHDNSEYHEIC